MPPEPLPSWDRKDFYKERKHEKLDSASLGSGPRWREPHHGARNVVRWAYGDFRRPSGHGKQGTWHLFPEEAGRGFTAPRSADPMMEDESYRPSVSCGDGKYSRKSRESRGGSLGHDRKKHNLETGAVSSISPSRKLDANVQRSVDDMLTYASHPHSEDQHDKMGTVNGLGTGQRSDRENSLGSIDWRPLKWTRSGSLSSRGSGFSHSSSSRSIVVDIVEAKTNLQPRNVTQYQSPSGDAAPCTSSVAPLEETSSRKRQRLGWGEGLAKYEKKKVDGPDESLPKNTESAYCFGSNLAMRSPIVFGFSDCTSPATPSSVGCSSSPGMEEKPFMKAMSVGNDTRNLSGSPGFMFQHHPEERLINLENLELNAIANLRSSIIELLQSDDISSIDSNVARSSAIDKLLIWKGDILKALEMTESEIDQLENELKSLSSQSGGGYPCAAASSCLPEKSGEKQIVASKLPALQFFSENMFVDTMIKDLEDVNVVTKDDDSPGTATSKFVDPLTLRDAASPSYVVEHGEYFADSDASRLKNVEVDRSNEESSECEGFKKFTDSKTAHPCSDDIHLCDDEGDISNDILSSNKEAANRSSEIFSKLLPKDQNRVDFCKASKIACCQNESLIKEKFMMRKRFLRFKEKVVSLKFRTFSHIWKEDMHFLSIRKYRAKSQKKIELTSRMPHNYFQKHRSLVRSQITSPSRNSLAPTREIINFVSKLLADTQVKQYRNTLKMPALILDKKEKMVSRFISSNGLVDDPCAVEKERAVINPWTSEERETFMDKLAVYGKDFRKIASFIDHKTIADCIEFYYKNHKSDCFARTKKKPESGKQVKSLPTNTYLRTPSKKWTRDLNAASLDMLGAASVLAACADGDHDRGRSCSGRILLGSRDSKTSCGDERSSSYNIDGNDKEAAAADVLAGICGSLSSEAMNSCITNSLDLGEPNQEWKYQKVGFVTKCPCTPETTQKVDDDTCSDESCGEIDSADWTDEEKAIFVQSISLYGKDFAMISRCVKTRSREACKVFFSKARKCLGLDLVHPVPGSDRMPSSDDANGSGSDAEDGHLLETGAVICSNKLGSKVDVDFPSPILSVIHHEFDPAGNKDMHSDLIISEEMNWVGNADFEDSKSRVDLVHDECQAGDLTEQILDCDLSKTENIVDKSVALCAEHTVISQAKMEAARDEVTGQGAPVEEPPLVATTSPSRLEVVNSELKVVDFVDGQGTDSEGERLVLPKDGPTDGWDVRGRSDTNASSLTGFCCSLRKSKSVGDTSHLSANTSRSSCSLGLLECQLNEFSELSCALKYPAVSPQPDTSLSIANAMGCKSAATQCEKTPNRLLSSSTFGFEDMGVKQCKKISVSTDDLQQHKPEDPSVDNFESPQTLQGYPLRMPIRKVANGDISCKKPSAFPILQEVDKNTPSGYSGQGCAIQRCNGLKLPSQSLEQSSDQRRMHARSLSDTKKPNRNGDVKLFGQILSHPSALQKGIVSTHDNEKIKETHQTKLSSKSFELKFDSHSSKFDPDNFLGMENLPIRSYGFWDGNRIQTGFPPWPDSAILLAKYPTAFTNLQAPPSKLELHQHQPLQAVIKSAEQNSNAVPVFPAQEMSNSIGMTNFCTKVSSPFSLDMKPRQDIYPSEVHGRNGFETISGQGRGMVGMNVVEAGGILGVSDPVAAIKMHYAKTDRLVGEVGSIMREDGTWRDAGDIGR